MDKIRILIAEDDKSTAQYLENFLLKDGFQVELVEDGNATWEVLQREDAPKLVILDWMMPGMTGVEVCKKLRAANEEFRTYVILLTAKAEKQDIIEGLDSGADDYIVKPVELTEFLARVRVAERMLAMQLQLLQRVNEQESLLRRYKLPGERVRNKNGSGDSNEESQPTESSDPSTAIPGLSSKVRDFRPIAQLNQIVANTLQEMGLSSVTPSTSPDSQNDNNSDFSAWSALIVKPLEVWFDFKLEVTRASAKKMFQQSVGSSTDSNEDLLDMLGETLNLIQENIKEAFLKEGFEAFTPFIPKAIETATPLLPEVKRLAKYYFSGADVELNLTLMEHPSPILTKSFHDIRPLDVLVEPILSPQKSSVLLNKATVLSDQYILKIKGLIKTWQDLEVSIVEPSPISRAIKQL